MLTGLTIGNFKAFGEPQHIPIRPLTLIFGANSSGKSSVLHSLMLVKHAVETGEWDVRNPSGGEPTVDLGGFPHYLHRPRTEEGCEFGFGLPVGRLGEFIGGRLVGAEAERAPFLQCRECVCTLRVERTPVKNADGSETSIAALQSVAIAFNGEPELHLHPALQAELGDVFMESALGERRNTFLLETHSEHLILRILRRVRETTEGTLFLWQAKPEGERLHARFLLTEYGGIKYDYGLDEERPGERTIVTLLPEKLWSELRQDYFEGGTTFGIDLSNDVFVVKGERAASCRP